MNNNEIYTQGGPAITGFNGTYIQRDQIIINLNYSPAPFHLGRPDLVDLRCRYLKYISESLDRIDFKGLRVIQAVEKASGLALKDIYVPLSVRPDLPVGETWQRIAGRIAGSENSYSSDEQTDLLQANEAVKVDSVINRQPALVLLGDPGSGKSTLLKMLASSLARQENAPLPILIPLSAYAQELEKNRISLKDYLPLYFASRQGTLRGIEMVFEVAFAQGQAVVMLDGLDEVQGQHEYLVNLVEDFVREIVPPIDRQINTATRAGNRVIVTSRFVGYRQAPLTDPRWYTYALVDWDVTEIEQFIDRWTYAVEVAMAGGHETTVALQKVQTERQELLVSINSNPGIGRLSGNPLLLTLLALIKRQGVTLPHRRVELYELYLQTLLRDWRVARAQDKKPVGPDIDYMEVLQVLAPLALWLRENNPYAGLISKNQLLDYLIGFYTDVEGLSKHDSRKAATNFLAAVHHYSNLLLERGREQYGFIHLTFEEYLAGKGLALLNPSDALVYILRYMFDPAWHETILLAIGALGIVNQSPNRAWEILEPLLACQMENDQHGANILLVGEILLDVEKAGVGPRAARIITQQLVKTMQDTQVSAGRRRQAGLILGQLGWRPEDIDEFIQIPTGQFLYSDPKCLETINHPFWIAKYPTTNSQFAHFIQDGGYKQSIWWSDVGWRWMMDTNRSQPDSWNNPERNNPIFPVIGVTRHEAEAYCQWMNANKKPSSIPSDYQIRLPTECEWERAARGEDGREYPWGNDFDPAFANTREGSSGGTTAICSYPQGISPCGVWDMSGNVWEWTTTPHEKGGCVVRGGSWFNGRWFALCTARSENRLSTFNLHLGFRVVLARAEQQPIPVIP